MLRFSTAAPGQALFIGFQPTTSMWTTQHQWCNGKASSTPFLSNTAPMIAHPPNHCKQHNTTETALTTALGTTQHYWRSTHHTFVNKPTATMKHPPYLCEHITQRQRWSINQTIVNKRHNKSWSNHQNVLYSTTSMPRQPPTYCEQQNIIN